MARKVLSGGSFDSDQAATTPVMSSTAARTTTTRMFFIKPSTPLASDVSSMTPSYQEARVGTVPTMQWATASETVFIGRSGLTILLEARSGRISLPEPQAAVRAAFASDGRHANS